MNNLRNHKYTFEKVDKFNYLRIIITESGQNERNTRGRSERAKIFACNCGNIKINKKTRKALKIWESLFQEE